MFLISASRTFPINDYESTNYDLIEILRQSGNLYFIIVARIGIQRTDTQVMCQNNKVLNLIRSRLHAMQWKYRAC